MTDHWQKLAERVKNFHGYFDKFFEQAYKNKALLMELNGIVQSVVTDVDSYRWLGSEQVLKMAFTRVYSLVVISDDIFKLFDTDSKLHDSVFEACFFTSLCTFIHHTKRLAGMSVSKFMDKTSPNKYDNQGKSSYINTRQSDEYRLRKTRNRLLSKRRVYIKRPEWSAMPMDSEHEWSFYFIINNIDIELGDTYKRIGNLYNDIYKELNSREDEGYQNRLVNAYKKFLTKLNKIEYEKVLKLYKEILEHMLKDQEYYGINLYRFERGLRLNNITTEVKRLLECKNRIEEDEILIKSIFLNDIHFPNVYRDFSDAGNPGDTAICAKAFQQFQDQVIILSLLVFDDLADNDYLGEWKTLFLRIINKMAESVFWSCQ